MGWQLEAVPAGNIAQGALVARMGPLFRLRLAFTPMPDQAPTAHGSLELTRPGTTGPPAALGVASAVPMQQGQGDACLEHSGLCQ